MMLRTARMKVRRRHRSLPGTPCGAFGTGKTMNHVPSCFLILVILFFGILAVPAGAAPSGTAPSGYITVTNPPVANFFTSTPSGPPPFTVSFSDTSLGLHPMTYLWEFGDGSVSSQQNPTHTYPAYGEYDVRLTVTNQYGSDTKTARGYIGVGIPPEADFSANRSKGEIPLTIAFTDLSRNSPATWSWDFGDGATASLQNPSHTYTQAGVYPVRLRVTNRFGSDALSKTGYINASTPVPVPVPEPVPPVKEKAGGIIGLIQEAKGTTNKNLPTAGIIPPQFMALAAVLTSFAVIVIQILLSNISSIAQLGMKIVKFLVDLAGGHAVEKISEKELEARKIEVRKLERHILGLSASEILVVEASVFMLAVAFIIADRATLDLQTVLIYMAVGAVSVIGHDFAHRWFATHFGHESDIQFWELGTVIMFLTAWLYGNAFAQTYRNLIRRRETLEETRERGIEMVAGPGTSIILMILFLFMVQFGGIWATAGGVGFTINLITAVYSLMPIETMDGLAIWKWNRGLYLALVLPMVAFYFFTFMIV